MPDSNSIKNWLEQVESFSIVPGWKWSGESWRRWSALLNAHSIPHAKDDYGNVLLGANNPKEWLEKLQSGSTPLVLQAHLDHPGAVVTSRIFDHPSEYRYSALLQGGLKGELVGRSFRLHNRDGVWLENVLVDEQGFGHRETFLSFKTKKPFELPLYLCGPTKEDDFSDRDDYLEGWGMDDHVGCAVILDYFARHPQTAALGLLTLDEEIGGFGFENIFLAGEKSKIGVADWPLLLTLEVTPEYPEQDFLVGRGARLRRADRKSALDPQFLQWGKEQGLGEGLELKKGSCEAGMWTQRGGRAGCFVLPCRNYHNATPLGEWRLEQVSESDVLSMAAAVEKIVAEWKGFSKVFLQDHLFSVREKARAAENYISCLKEVLPEWNALHHHFGLALVNFPQGDWNHWRDKLTQSKKWVEPIRQAVEQWLEPAREWLGVAENKNFSVPIHLFVGASFNACNMAQGIGLSVEKLLLPDLPRILCHELTHWWIGPHLARRHFRPVVSTFINEGLACLATAELLGLPPERVLGLRSDQIAGYRNNYSELKKEILAWFEGDLWEIKWGRHEQVRYKKLKNPFQTGTGHDWPKYGYFLAIDFLERCPKPSSLNWAEWVDNVDVNLVLDYFKETTNQETLAACG